MAKAEKRFGEIASEKLDVNETIALLALCTLAALDRTKPNEGSLDIATSDEEIARTAERIVSDEYYRPGPAFPYTREEMAAAFGLAV